jgi:hypothetical protein
LRIGVTLASCRHESQLADFGADWLNRRSSTMRKIDSE